MNTTGGFIYHLRALRYYHNQWVAHRNSTFNFLDAWVESLIRPKEKSLVIIGPSGGYSLSESFLNAFESVVLYEPDPIARMIFSRRFKKIKPHVRFIASKYDFKSELPPGAVLFCNILGQIEIADLLRFKTNLERVLEKREWASYHDALSGENLRLRVPSFSHPKIDASQIGGWIETRSVRQVEAIAHLAPDLFQDREKMKFFYWDWRITNRRTHLIEGVFCSSVI